ncbi:hypothetical protein Pmani_036826 [Petrolisthes manimaculis]|uniref:Uncharacterized protein n=1 Tax=Petrolisthes manimaculis TaxID=1843537 RepID=A0AAE1TNZ7_9EUCA|nr:hypothetical protein Pmani_036826 [Petrolisthes manimaculis]
MYRRGTEKEEWKKRKGDVGGRKSTRHSLLRVNTLDRVQWWVEVNAVGGSWCCGCLLCLGRGQGWRGSSEVVMSGGSRL